MGLGGTSYPVPIFWHTPNYVHLPMVICLISLMIHFTYTQLKITKTDSTHNWYTTILLKPAPRIYGWQFLALPSLPTCWKSPEVDPVILYICQWCCIPAFYSARGFQSWETALSTQKLILIGQENHRLWGFKMHHPHSCWLVNYWGH